jgi:hypothetical protein
MDAKASEPKIPMVSLEVSGEAGEAPWRLPAGVQHFSGNTVTLKIPRPGGWAEWTALTNRAASLIWETPEGGLRHFAGRVTWVEPPDPNQEGVVLTVDLLGPAQEMKDFEEQVLNAPKDIKNLWEKWDEAHQGGWQSPASRGGGRLLGFTGLALAALGVGLYFWGSNLPAALPPLAILAGAALAFWSWRRLRA